MKDFTLQLLRAIKVRWRLYQSEQTPDKKYPKFCKFGVNGI